MRLLDHMCQPSRIRRDSPAFSSDVPRPAKSDRCPAFFENGIILFRCRLFYMFASQSNKVTNLEQRPVQSSHADRSLIINTLYYRSMRHMPSILHARARQPSPTTVYFLTLPRPPSASTLLPSYSQIARKYMISRILSLLELVEVLSDRGQYQIVSH